MTCKWCPESPALPHACGCPCHVPLPVGRDVDERMAGLLAENQHLRADVASERAERLRVQEERDIWRGNWKAVNGVLEPAQDAVNRWLAWYEDDSPDKDYGEGHAAWNDMVAALRYFIFITEEP